MDTIWFPVFPSVDVSVCGVSCLVLVSLGMDGAIRLVIALLLFLGSHRCEKPKGRLRVGGEWLVMCSLGLCTYQGTYGPHIEEIGGSSAAAGPSHNDLLRVPC